MICHFTHFAILISCCILPLCSLPSEKANVGLFMSHIFTGAKLQIGPNVHLFSSVNSFLRFVLNVNVYTV